MDIPSAAFPTDSPSTVDAACTSTTVSVHGCGNFDALGEEKLVIEILSHLSKQELDAFALANKACSRLSADKSLWPPIFTQLRPGWWQSLDEATQDLALEQYCQSRVNPNPYTPAGPLCYGGEDVRNVAITGDTLVGTHLFGTALQVWNHRTGELRNLYGHEKYIECCAVDGNIAVSGSDDGVLKVWNVSTGELRRTIRGHRGGLRECLIAGDRIVSLCVNRNVCIWAVDTGAQVAEIYHSSRFGHPNMIIIDDMLVIQHGGDGYKAYDLRTGAYQHGRSPAPAGVRDLGGILAVNTWWDGVRRLNPKTGNEDFTPLLTAKFSPLSVEGNSIVGTSGDGVLCIWDGDAGTLLHSWDAGQGDLTSCEVAGGKIYSCGNESSQVKVWDLTTRRLCQSFGQGSIVRRCYIVGTALIARTEGTPNLWVWARHSERHKKLQVVPLSWRDYAASYAPRHVDPKETLMVITMGAIILIGSAFARR